MFIGFNLQPHKRGRSMFQKSLFCIVILCLWAAQSFAAAKFPFPQDQTYSKSSAIKPTGADHNIVQSAYMVWLNNFYEESGTMARIKWDKPAQTVSEGIGYGMLIFVWMDNATNNTQGKFDKLWAYYQNFKDGNGLMNWKVNGFSATVESGGATDGDIDVALGLTLAYYQWGDAKYQTAANGILNTIYSKEVNPSNKLLYPGDQWTDPKNPSYFITAGLGIFSKINSGNDWAAVKTACYTLLKSCSSKNSTGLVPDWCDDQGNANGKGPTYLFDAARTPWRMALAYCWNGDVDAQTVAGKMNTWIKGATNGDPSKIKSGYNLNGTPTDTFNIPTFIGPFACGAMTDAGGQTWLDACYNRLSSFIDNTNYYNQCLQVLSQLLLTGNALDFSSATPKTAFKIVTSVSPTGSGSVTVTPSQATYTAGTSVTISVTATGTNKFVSWSGDLSGTTASQTITISHDMNVTANFNAGSGDLVDDCEHANDLTRMGGKWFTYNDASQAAKSTVTPLTSTTNLFTMTDGGANSSAKCAKITYSLDAGSYKYNPFVGVGFWLKKPSTTDTILDISAATGLTFFYKGDTCDVRIETSNITDAGYFHTRIPKATDWTAVSVKWTSMIQATWAKVATFDRTKATKVAWQTPDYTVTGMSGSIAVDDIHLTGFAVPSATKPIALTPARERSFSVACDNAKTLTIRYSLAVSTPVEIALYDLSGKIVHRLFSGERHAGANVQTIGLPGAMPRGTYMVQMKSEAGVHSDKIAFVK